MGGLCTGKAVISIVGLSFLFCGAFLLLFWIPSTALGGGSATPITTWNGFPVGDGEIGSVAKGLCQAIERDMSQGIYNALIPYGEFSGIES